MRTPHVLVILLAFACGGKTATPTTGPAVTTADNATAGDGTAALEPLPRKPGVQLVVTPADAEINVDGEDVGPASALPGGFLDLAPGMHQISIRKAGFDTWRVEVMVRDEAERLTVELKAAGP